MGRGKAWTPAELHRLDRCVDEYPTLTPDYIHREHFPYRTYKAVHNKLSRHPRYTRPKGPGGSHKPWTTREVDRLRNVIEGGASHTWEDVASRMPGRTANACRQAASSYISLEEGRNSHLHGEDYIVRKHGPTPPWGKHLAKIMRDAKRKLGYTDEDIEKLSGVHRHTVGNMLGNRRFGRVSSLCEVCEAIGLDAGEALSRGLAAAKAAAGTGQGREGRGGKKV